MSSQTSIVDNVIADRPSSPIAMAPWAPASRVGSGPRPMLTGARLFAALVALLVLTRRGVA